MSATVIKIAKASPKTSKPTNPNRSVHFRRKMNRQLYAAVGVGAITTILTALSLSHLAHGITIVTGADGWEAWAMAVAIDLGFMSMEAATLMAATDKLCKSIARFTKPAIIGTLTGSALMNAFAFASGAVGYMIAPAVVFGLAIPAMIYCLTRTGAALYIDCNSKG